ncbi:hypothetical protein Tco_0748375 [Tanacetum coccineum]|uniref:Uncharacterized protein n=1 Tax=Tanacetum coccineum TaxID=301880 RepID=A0ABQ4YVG4_9ASTR
MTQDIGAHAAVHIFNRISFAIAKGAWYLDDDTIIGDTMVVGKKQASLYGARLLCGPASVDFNFSNELVMKRVAKTIMLMDTIVKIDDPECDVLNYAFLAYRFQSASLQAQLLRYYGIIASGSAFNDVVCVPLFFVLKSCSACSKVFTRDIYGDHAILYAEVDIGLGGGCDKPLRLTDMLLYSWDKGLDVCGFEMVLTFDADMCIGYIKKDKKEAKMDKSEHKIGRV